VQRGQGGRGEQQPGAESDEPAGLMAGRVGAPADAEGEPAVDGGIADGRDEQAHRVGQLRGHDAAQPEVEKQVGERARHADQDEPEQLPGQVPGWRLGGQRVAELRHPYRAAAEPPGQPRDTAQVSERGGEDVDARVAVVDPVHGDFVDAQPCSFGQNEQFCVEKPPGVLRQRQEQPGPVRADGLEATLRVGEARAERGVQQHVVAAGDDLAARAADHPRAASQPGPDGEVAVPGQQRRDQRQQGVQVGGQVHVHVSEDVRVTRRPERTQRSAPAGFLQPDGPDFGELRLQRARDRPGLVGAAVVRDGDPRGEREAGPQVRHQAADAPLEVALLVADRHHDLDLRRAISQWRPGFVSKEVLR